MTLKLVVPEPKPTRPTLVVDSKVVRLRPRPPRPTLPPAA